MKTYLLSTALLLAFFCQFPVGHAQPNAGVPFITNYSSNSYKQGTQNFAVVQDTRGVLYFGNNNGVLEYDGISWRLIPVKNKSEVHSLMLDEKGRLYVGAQGDFGYLEPNLQTGELSYHSLLPKLDSAFYRFNDVWNINTVGDQIIFRSTSYVFIYQKDTIKAISLSNSNHRSGYVNGKYLIWQSGKGIFQLQGDSLAFLPETASLANETVNTFLPHKGDTLLLVSTRGVYKYINRSLFKFETEIDPLILNQNVYGIPLANGSYALGGRTSGFLLMDQEGHLLQHIDRKKGLQDESVWAICSDKLTGDIWLALNNGISLIEINSPFTHFGIESNVEGQFYNLNLHQNYLYGVGSVGVFRKPWSTSNKYSLAQSKFEPVPNAQGQSWYSYTDESDLLIAANAGMIKINENGKASSLGFKGRVWFYVPLSNYPGYMIANTSEGLFLLRKQQGTWEVYKNITPFADAYYYFVEDEKGYIWADSPIRGVYRIDFSAGIDQQPEIKLFNQEYGLPSNFKIKAFKIGGKVVFGTENGLYRFDYETERFQPDTQWNRLLFPGEPHEIEWLKEDQYQNIWFIMNRKVDKESVSAVGYAFKDKNGKYGVKIDPFHKISSYKVRDFLTIDEENIYLATSDGIIHYNPSKEQQPEFHVLLRSVEFMSNDSIIYHGIFIDESGRTTINQPSEQKFVFDFQHNSLRFHFSSMDFKVPNSNKYQFYLEGFDQNWNQWTTNASKEYTNLPEGTYTLHVRARNQYHQISTIQTFRFEVLPPWYRTIMAYVIYMLTGSLLIYLFMNAYARNLKSQNERLEQMVSDRTAEVRKQNQDILEKNHLLESQKEEIEAQKEDILHKNEELRKAQEIIAGQYEELKNINANLEEKVGQRTEELRRAYQDLLVLKNELDTFIYKSSHDIKGPMMRLKGLFQVAMLDVKDDTALGYIKMLENEADSTIKVLQKLITFYNIKNSVPSRQHIVLEDLIRQTIELHKNTIQQRGIHVLYDIAQDVPELKTDLDLLKIALNHTFENALQYSNSTDARVSLAAERRGQTIYLHLIDNGMGISAEVQRRLFEMFFRGTEKSSGAGLGLYTAREAMRKIGGKLTFIPHEHQTEFVLEFPIELPD
ncbi:triple tyrosine motif-containing protein [Cytophagales bacterium LB-30]|uniref:histidine kinase n=1 Tax=Shiella aurantiaca TaxID=3058365 RepID=A0ABT8F0S2_9BACT|nr:ATP-binding protein [Shiella aurantiaca]MDN4164035.1 triple tyrosine motif-containing protein [Shiella aurantiaca]